MSGVPIGDTLSDGHGHSFTATAGRTSVDVTSWTLSSLTIKTTSDTDFILTATATEVDGDGNTSTATTNEPVTVNPWHRRCRGGRTHPVPRVRRSRWKHWLRRLIAGRRQRRHSVAGSEPGPDWRHLSDGHGHSFTATANHTSVDVTSWTLSSLTIKTTSDTADFILTATATEVDGDGNTSTATTNEPVTVNPLAPTVSWGANTPGTEGTTITLATLAATANSLAGDSDGIQSLAVSGVRLATL